MMMIPLVTDELGMTHLLRRQSPRFASATEGHLVDLRNRIQDLSMNLILSYMSRTDPHGQASTSRISRSDGLVASDADL